MTVQIISMNVLCVVLDGSGLAPRRKRKTTQNRRNRTSRLTPNIIGTRIALLIQCAVSPVVLLKINIAIYRHTDAWRRLHRGIKSRVKSGCRRCRRCRYVRCFQFTGRCRIYDWRFRQCFLRRQCSRRENQADGQNPSFQKMSHKSLNPILPQVSVVFRQWPVFWNQRARPGIVRLGRLIGMVAASLKLPIGYFFSFLTLIFLAMQCQYGHLGRKAKIRQG